MVSWSTVAFEISVTDKETVEENEKDGKHSDTN